MFRTAAALALTFAVSSLPAAAAERENAEQPLHDGVASVTSARFDALPTPTAGVLDTIHGGNSRPGALTAMYSSFAALQAFDFYSTRRAIAQGGVEANPAMRGVVSNTAAFVAIKAVTTVAPMLIAERMWRTNRVGAIVTMIVANGAMAAVAANNAHVMQQPR